MTTTINRRIETSGEHTEESAGVDVLARGMGHLASWPVWIVSAVLFVGFAGVFFASSAPFAIPEVTAACGDAPLDVRPFSTGDEVAGFLDACGPDGREAYRDMQIADLLYPAVFGLFMASSLALALTHRFPRRPAALALAAVPLVASAFDYLENLFAWVALAAHPADAPTNRLLGLASAAKTTTSWVAGAMLLLTVGALVIRAVRRRVPMPGGELRSRRPADVGSSS